MDKMTKFQIQTIEGKLKHDFSFHLIQAIEYQNWWNEQKTWDYQLVEIEEMKEGLIPVGSVEFVEKYFKDYFDIELKPLNVPVELFDFAGRTIENVTKKDLKDNTFVKSNTKFKNDTNGIYSPQRFYSRDNYQISEIIGIESEYRCFVYKKELKGIHYYSGDFRDYPQMHVIEDMINAYKDQPIAWTLDVGVDDNDNTFIIEAHDFFSCGLYGFADYTVLPQMLARWFYEAQDLERCKFCGSTQVSNNGLTGYVGNSEMDADWTECLVCKEVWN